MPDKSGYTIVYQKAARRALSETLPEQVAAAAFEFCEGPLAGNPHRVGTALRVPFDGYHGARRGTYRVIYMIHETNRTVTVELISHRVTAYRPAGPVRHPATD